jgi:DNA mismatch repair protein MutS
VTGFVSVLFPGGTRPPGQRAQEPECFRDLNIDQIVESATAGREFYNLKPLFYAGLTSVAEVEYRQGVHRDLERPAIRAPIDAFAQAMQDTRDCLHKSSRLRYPHQKRRLFLDAVLAYGDAVRCLAHDLRQGGPSSAGLRTFTEYLSGYVGTAAFAGCYEQARELAQSLAAVRYTLHIRGSRVRVSRYAGEPDYSEEVRACPVPARGKAGQRAADIPARRRRSGTYQSRPGHLREHFRRWAAGAGTSCPAERLSAPHSAPSR